MTVTVTDENWIAAMDRYVLCRAASGFNDVLCQIQLCRAYCEEYRRILYVDTTRSGLDDEFDVYFSCDGDAVLHSMPEFLWNSHRKMPNELDGSSMDYPIMGNQEIKRRVLGPPFPPTVISFDPGVDHEEGILVHDQSGGGDRSHAAWDWLRMKDWVADKILGAVDRLPASYAAVHVRNTDLRTDYRAFFERIDPLLGDAVVVCTDDFECIRYARTHLGSRLVLTSDIPDNRGKPLHKIRTDRSTRRRFNATMMTDLFVLASASRLFITEVTEGGRFSGYSMLAEYLHRSPSVRGRVLGIDPVDDPTPQNVHLLTREVR